MNLKEINEVTEEEFLKNYKPYDYERPSLTVDMILFTLDDEEEKDLKKVPEKVLKVLLIKRKNHPFKNCWAIPGGFVDINENIEDAVYRELKEETNIDNVYLEQLYTWGDVNRDPRMRVISSAYMALIPSRHLKPKAGDDAEDVQWFSISREDVSSTEKEDSWLLHLCSDDEKVKIFETNQKRRTGCLKRADATSIFREFVKKCLNEVQKRFFSPMVFG